MNTKSMTIAGWVLSGLFALFMFGASAFPKFAGMPVVDETLTQLGWPTDMAIFIGVIEVAVTVLYLIPRTNILGAILSTALLGGAIATQVRVGNPLFSHELFGIYLGVVLWGGLWLRSPRLRALFPLAERPA